MCFQRCPARIGRRKPRAPAKKRLFLRVCCAKVGKKYVFLNGDAKKARVFGPLKAETTYFLGENSPKLSLPL